MALSLSATRGSATVRPIVKPTLPTFIQVAPLRASTANMPSRSEFVDFEKDSLDEGAHVREWPMSWGYAALQVRQHKDRARVSKQPGEDSTVSVYLSICKLQSRTLRASEITFVSAIIVCGCFPTTALDMNVAVIYRQINRIQQRCPSISCLLNLQDLEEYTRANSRAHPSHPAGCSSTSAEAYADDSPDLVSGEWPMAWSLATFEVSNLQPRPCPELDLRGS